MNKENLEKITNIFTEKGYEIISIEKKSVPIEYKCKCGKIKKQLFKDFIRRNCRWCRDLKLQQKPDSEIIDDSGEIWKPTEGGWISNLGNAKNIHGKILTLCPTKFRFRINKKHQYASRLIAVAFKINNYEKINDNSYVVTHIDNNSSNNNVNNLKIITRLEISKKRNTTTHQSETFKTKSWWVKNRFDNIDHINIPEYPNHIIYKNGEMWNGTRFLTFSKSSNYFNISTSCNNDKVHRIICYAFNPIDDYKELNDYKKLEVNHIDGNTFNNHANNLEWVTPSENMKHAYETNINSKKCVKIIQKTKDGLFINEFPSIAQASRETSIPEHIIRTVSKGKVCNKSKYLWEFKNKEQSDKNTKKYSIVPVNIKKSPDKKIRLPPPNEDIWSEIIHNSAEEYSTGGVSRKPMYITYISGPNKGKKFEPLFLEEDNTCVIHNLISILECKHMVLSIIELGFEAHLYNFNEFGDLMYRKIYRKNSIVISPHPSAELIFIE